MPSLSLSYCRLIITTVLYLILSNLTKGCLHFHLITSRRQVLVSMSSVNSSKFMILSNKHVSNINKVLKEIKSDIMADFAWTNSIGLIITTNKVVFSLNLNTIEKYIKNVDIINSDNIIVPRLPQFKLFLKILDIPYLIEDTNIFITSDIIEKILQSTHIFNNVTLISKLHVIKASPKLDMAVIWINIWDAQSGSKTKGIINRCFNVDSQIVTVQDTNMNPGIPQCKNCWKWEHIIFSYHIHRAKHIKCNRPHKLEHYCDLT